jgi:hypothetical protein
VDPGSQRADSQVAEGDEAEALRRRGRLAGVKDEGLLGAAEDTRKTERLDTIGLFAQTHTRQAEWCVWRLSSVERQRGVVQSGEVERFIILRRR